MIRCLMDTTLPTESRCNYCCIYCVEQCEYKCELAIDCKEEENVIKADCCNAYEE